MLLELVLLSSVLDEAFHPLTPNHKVLVMVTVGTGEEIFSKQGLDNWPSECEVVGYHLLVVNSRSVCSFDKNTNSERHQP